MLHMPGLDDLRSRGGMDWIDDEKGWIAAPDDVVGALSKDGFDECKRETTTSRRDIRPAGGVWQGVNARTGSVAPGLARDPYRDDGGEGRSVNVPKDDQCRRSSAAVLLVITSVIWLHEWFPILFVAAFVLWAIVHDRLEGNLGDVLLRRWRRLWPPKTLVLVPLLLAGTLVYWLSDVPIRVKILPVTLNVIALSMIALGGWASRPRPAVVRRTDVAPV